MSTNQPATKQDVEDVVGEIVNDALKEIFKRFDRIDWWFDRIESKANRPSGVVNPHKRKTSLQ